MDASIASPGLFLRIVVQRCRALKYDEAIVVQLPMRASENDKNEELTEFQNKFSGKIQIVSSCCFKLLFQVVVYSA